jgi:hypothetical protein
VFEAVERLGWLGNVITVLVVLVVAWSLIRSARKFPQHFDLIFTENLEVAGDLNAVAARICMFM